MAKTEVTIEGFRDEFRELMMQERQGLLARVNAIEEFLEMPRTSEARKFARSNGWEQWEGNVTDTLDVTEEKPK